MALVLMNCTNAELGHFSSKDSPQMHIAVILSSKVNVTQLTITAPGDSPNTDGVHIDRSHDVHITGSTIGTGDDCISIGPGSRFVTVDGIMCGPGHGVSVGSLGRNGAMDSVEHIDVKNVHFINTMNGARIKTWQRAVELSNITYANLRGTSSRKTAVDFDCGDSGSCTDIHVSSVVITASDGRGTEARCRNARGKTSGYVYPRIPCL